MNPALHILAKDLRRFWALIFIAVAVTLFGYCVPLSHLEGTRLLSGMGGNLVKVMQQAPLARWVMVFLLSVWVVLEDRGVGDRIAWMTRPIFARELAIAKFLFLVVGVALPAGFIAAGIALWLKASLTSALAAAVSDALLVLFAASIFGGLAVVCASMNQAVLLTAGAFGGVLVLVFVLFEVMHVTLPHAPRGLTRATSFLVVTSLATISGAAMLGHQYATRRTRRTLFCTAGLVLGIWALGNWWPVNVWPKLTVFSSASPSPVEQLKLVASNNDADFRTGERALDEPRAAILVPLRLEGGLPDRNFRAGTVNSTLVMEEGVKISTSKRFPDPEIEDDLAAAAALGFSTPAVPPLRYLSVVECPLEQFKQLQGHSGRLEASINVVERHYEKVAQLPVQVGAELRKDGHMSRILSTQFTNGVVVVGFQFVEINPILGTRSNPWPNRYLLVNHKRGEYSDAYGAGISGTGGPDMTFITSFMRFGETRSQKTSAIAGKIDAGWLADAELYFLIGREENAPLIPLSLTIEKLTIPVKQVTRHIIMINPDGTRSEYDR